MLPGGGDATDSELEEVGDEAELIPAAAAAVAPTQPRKRQRARLQMTSWLQEADFDEADIPRQNVAEIEAGGLEVLKSLWMLYAKVGFCNDLPAMSFAALLSGAESPLAAARALVGDQIWAAFYGDGTKVTSDEIVPRQITRVMRVALTTIDADLLTIKEAQEAACAAAKERLAAAKLAQQSWGYRAY